MAAEFLATWDEVRIEIVDGPVEVEDGLLIAENVATFEDETASKFRLEARGSSRFGTASRSRSRSTRRSAEALEAAGLRE